MLQVGKKPTKNEKLLRVDTVYGMLCDGKARSDILRQSAELWDLVAEGYVHQIPLE